MIVVVAAVILGAQAMSPRLVETSQPEYPARALADRVSASVELRLRVDTEGRVEQVHVTRTTTVAERPSIRVSASTAAYGFAAAAVEAARKLRFSPLYDNSEPVPFEIGYTYRFALPALEPRDPVVRLHGVVRAAGRRTRLPGAVVTIVSGDEAYEATTDSQGRFVFYDLSSGIWSLRIDRTGYQLGSSEERIRATEVTEVSYYLRPSDEQDYDVTVEATPVRREVTRRALTANEISAVPGTLGDPVLVVENLPGVARTGIDGGLVVRGSSPQDSMIMIEDVPVLIETHFGGFRSVVAPQLVERVDFVPGNFSARYGGRTGGILDVQLKRLNPDQVHGELELSLLDVGLYLEAPITEDLSVAVAGRRSHVDAFLGAVVSDDDVRLVAAPRYYDYQALVSWRPLAGHDVELFLLGSDDRMELVFDDAASIDALATGTNVRNATSFQRLSLRHRYGSPVLQHSLLAAIGRDDIRQRLFGRFDFDASIRQLIVREEVEWRPVESVELIGGFDMQHRVLDFDITAPRPPKEGQPGDAFDAPSLNARGRGRVLSRAGGYVEAQLRPVAGLTLIPGARVDRFFQVDEWSWDPRLVARLKLGAEWTVRGGVGRVHQAPEIDETDPTYGNPDLELISAMHYAVGATYAPGLFLSVDVSGFYKDLSSVVRPTDAVSEVDGASTPLIFDNGGRGRSFGLEILLRLRRWHGLEGWLSYTLSRAERTDSRAGDARLFDYDQTHVLTLVATYRLGQGWSTGLRWRYVSGRPVTPILGGIWRADRDAFEAIPGAINSQRLPAFHQLDLRVDRRWVFDTWQLTAFVSVSNAYDRRNVEDVGYNYDYTETDSVSGLPVLPIIGIKAQL